LDAGGTVAALRDCEGRVAVALDDSEIGRCAEIAALFEAIANGLSDPVCVVAVTGKGEIARPCSRCQQILSDYCPEVGVIISTRTVASLSELRAEGRS
jgi:cytidine deaminase